MPLKANEKTRRYDTNAQTAGSDVLANDITPSASPVAFQITIQVASASTVDLVETADGTTKSQTLNSGAQLDAGELYSFEVPVRDAGSYNIQLGSGVAIDVLNIDEKLMGAI